MISKRAYFVYIGNVGVWCGLLDLEVLLAPHQACSETGGINKVFSYLSSASALSKAFTTLASDRMGFTTSASSIIK